MQGYSPHKTYLTQSLTNVLLYHWEALDKLTEIFYNCLGLELRTKYQKLRALQISAADLLLQMCLMLTPLAFFFFLSFFAFYV